MLTLASLCGNVRFALSMCKLQQREKERHACLLLKVLINIAVLPLC